MRVSTYLSFNGDCAAAFAFYAECLGATVIMTMHWGDTPMKHDVPAALHEKVAHTRLQVGQTILMGSDSPPDRFKPMAGAVVSVEVASPEEARTVFDALAEGGTVQMALQPTFWSAAFGMLKDRYGVAWMVDCERPG